ncbi:hypothetical protein EMCRGX_G000953 [Ephydatia muelleri]
MPSRNQKKRSKQRAEYLQKREDILSQENKAKARARYKADPEKKKASVRDTYKADPEKKKASVRDTYKADPEKKKASVRDTYKADPEKKKAYVRDTYKADPEKKASVRDTYNANAVSKRASKRQRYQEGVEENRAANRRLYRGNSATIKAARRIRYWKGRRTTTTTQSYSLFEPNSRTLAEYGVRLEKAILRDTQKVVTRSARAAVSKISADALLAKALSVRRSQAGSLLKTIRKVNAKKLQESDILVGHRFHTAGAEPYFFDNSYTHTKQHGAIPVDLNALASGNIEELIPFMGMKDNLSDVFSEDGVEHAVVSEDHSSSGLGCIERDLKVTHADLIAELHHPEKKKASVRDSYNADIESKQSTKRQRYQEDIEENRAAKRQKYEDNSAAIKASERNRYWNDPAVRLAKRAAERKRFRMGHRTTTTTTTQSYSLYEPKSHALMEYNGGLEKAILRDSELLSEVNDAFCKSHPLLAQKVVTRSACAAMQCCPPYRPPPAVAAALPPPPPPAAAELPPPPAAELPPPPAAAELPEMCMQHVYSTHQQLCPAYTSSSSRAAPTATSSSSRAAPTATSSSSRAAATSRGRSIATCTSPTTGTSSIDTSAPTTTSPAAPLAAATTTHMAPMARTRPPQP